MIPKIIHYCWFGKSPMPASHKAYLKTWRTLMPDYKIKRWDESNFDINCNVYVQNAYKQKKYAFISDYVRLKALYSEGGFYFDTDVELFKSLDSFNKYNFISGIAFFIEFEDFKHLLNDDFLPKDTKTLVPCLGIMNAVMGAQPNNELIRDMINFYDNIGKGDDYLNGIVLDQIMANEAIKYGFKFKDEQQTLSNNQLLVPSNAFCSISSQVTTESFLFHHCALSWQTQTKVQRLHSFLDRYYLLKYYKAIKKIKRIIFNLYTK